MEHRFDPKVYHKTKHISGEPGGAVSDGRDLGLAVCWPVELRDV
jgi:hypothetical protein